MTQAASKSKHDLIELGRLGKTFGLLGGLKVHSYTDPSQNIFKYDEWLLKTATTTQAMRLSAQQPHQHHLVVYLEGISHIDSATPWVGATLWVPRSTLPNLTKDEYYWTDLQGLTIINQENKVLGQLDHFIATGANDVMVIKGQQEELLIPYLLETIVKDIDLNQGIIRIQWPML